MGFLNIRMSLLNVSDLIGAGQYRKATFIADATESGPACPLTRSLSRCSGSAAGYERNRWIVALSRQGGTGPSIPGVARVGVSR